MKVFYYIIHTFKGCRDQNLKSYKGSASVCEKCGRTVFIFRC